MKRGEEARLLVTLSAWPWRIDRSVSILRGESPDIQYERVEEDREVTNDEARAFLQTTASYYAPVKSVVLMVCNDGPAYLVGIMLCRSYDAAYLAQARRAMADLGYADVAARVEKEWADAALETA